MKSIHKRVFKTVNAKYIFEKIYISTNLYIKICLSILKGILLQKRIYVLEREREMRETCLQWPWARSETGTQAHNPGLLHGWKGPNNLKHHLCCSGFALARRLEARLELVIELGHHNMGHRHLGVSTRASQFASC